ncbi:hypothetical protein MLD38_023523 [Melastoma candidum]|uniref:Uncharacterized protein n=1 Tax=Melastoma candidum TaxID=119954 RepID=A0ACB9NW15_9MYRT|nr:hypothetical protein MLD38_023523 [Melastoma candidum]
MDCDENDFQSQSQNQQLADEGSAKYSPVLQPFGLSKFDFDDNLQEHLRFDSLVESEVFLGIESNVESQWIEDYSQGNAAIEFATCASESCPISRHNNVWSEATSSESVEMLLKSVGLEEAMPRQPAIQPSNSSEPCSTITQMEPNLTDDTGIVSDKADASNGESRSPVSEILPGSTVEKAVEGHQPFEEAVLTFNGTSSEGNIIKGDLSIQCGNFGSPTIINVCADRTDVVAHGESAKSQNSSDLEVQELNRSAGMETAATDCDKAVNVAVLDEEVTKSQKDAKSGGPLAITEEDCGNNEYFEETTASDIQFASETVVSDHLTKAYLEEGSDTRINAVLEPPDAPLKASHDIQSVDELAGGLSFSTTSHATTLVENVVLDQDVGVGGLSEGKESWSPPVPRLTEDVDKLDPDIGVRSIVADVSSGFEVPMNSSERKSLLAIGTSTENINALDPVPFPVEVKLPAPSAVTVEPEEEVRKNDAAGDPVDQVNREQVATENSKLPVGPAENTLGPSELNQGLTSLAGEDGVDSLTNPEPEVPVNSGEAALESSAGNNVANAEKMDTSLSQLSGSVLPSELLSHHSTPEVDRGLTCKDVADGAVGESHHVSESEMIEAATHGPQIVDTEKEVVDISGSTVEGDGILPTLERPDKVSVEGNSTMAPGNIFESPVLPSIDHSNSSQANVSSPIVISSVGVFEKEITQEQSEKSINQKILASDRKDVFDLQNTKETLSSKDDKSFTFDVMSLDKRDLTKNWHPLSSASDLRATQFAEGSTIPALLQVESQGLVLNNTETPQKTVKGTSRGRKKDSSEPKPRRASRKGVAKNSEKKSSSVKDSAASKLIETVDKLSPHSVTPPGSQQILPSAFGNMVFCQPFTDFQQVQLRAQIFVYGSLISKLIPEEVHMMSAFGGPDGGRSMWENAWRLCRERVLGQASSSTILETPVKSRAGEVIFDQVTNPGSRQASVSSSPAVRSNSKGIASPAISLVQPVGSPVWSISTQSFDASQFGTLPKGAIQPAFSTFHPVQSSPVANFFGPSSSRMPQTPFRSPWTASSQTSMQDPGARLPLLPVTESVKLAPVLESPISVPSGTERLPSVPAGLLPAASPSVDPKKAAILPAHPSSGSKSRKRKKASIPGDSGQISSQQSQIQLSPIPAPVGPHSAIVAPTSTYGFFSEARMDKHVPKSPSHSFGNPGLQEFDKSESALPEESIVKVREARKQAEDAAALASAAMSHSQAIWDQLDKRKNSGTVATADAKLASAAAAVSAAASVAKAAAAAASVASKAALQAKLMADEAMNPSTSNGHSSIGEYSSIIGGKDVSLSILRGDSAINFSNSAISEAREAVRKKIEAASAASLQAENLDALVKAAELAAEAIAKAGKVVAMGDPLPLTVLAEAGPEGFWELASPKRISELHVAKMGDVVATITGSSQQMARLNDKGTLGRSVNDTLGVENSGLGKKGAKVSNMGNGEQNLLPELQQRPKEAHSDVYGAVETPQQNSIAVGSQVEVFKSGEGFKSAWFSANVLSLKDGKALVCYSEIPSDEGSGKLEEWVDTECVGDEPPKLRIAHPMTIMKFEGTRKRRRAAMGVVTCSVGDKVDAWIKDSWREGVVTDKDKKDGTTVTVHFPAYGDASIVRSWHLRPSLIWKNGEWVEWASAVGSLNKYIEGDTPQGKRAKLGSPGPVPREKDKESKETQHVVNKEKPLHEESLKLTSDEKVFNMGKKGVDGKKDPVRTRTGLRKESSRVVIGVPKPGKKRKFMEVSKHLVGNQTKKTDELKDSTKLASYLIPQGGGPRGWKPFSRSDSKDKGVADSKAKVLRSGRSQNTSGRTLPPKNNLAAANSSGVPTQDVTDHDGFKRHNTSELKPLSESQDAASEGHADLVRSSDTGSFKTSATGRAARVTKGRVPSGKVAKAEDALNNDPSKSTADGAEPRRSIRRIQPTSRLLEGLQSSITINKFPSALHDRGQKVASKVPPKGKSNG